ncbi:MAG: oligoribonuclease [bacterium]|nr:oligoribonuclease [bacterium]MCY4164125.1 oligoribonuclease [bacterium]
MLAWLDLEMTGLDPAQDVIVEIASIVTTDLLEVVAEGPDLVVLAPPEVLASMAPEVVEMHTSSGLIEEIRNSTLNLHEAGEITLDFLSSHIAKPASVPLCGNSIGVDRRFLIAQLPELERFFHYRTIDVSTVKELARRWSPEVYDNAPEKAKGHRALDDIRESINELRHYREQFFRLP